jgi:hypothetical protein
METDVETDIVLPEDVKDFYDNLLNINLTELTPEYIDKLKELPSDQRNKIIFDLRGLKPELFDRITQVLFNNGLDDNGHNMIDMLNYEWDARGYINKLTENKLMQLKYYLEYKIWENAVLIANGKLNPKLRVIREKIFLKWVDEREMSEKSLKGGHLNGGYKKSKRRKSKRRKSKRRKSKRRKSRRKNK